MFNSKISYDQEIQEQENYKKQNIEKSRQQIIKNLEAKKKQQVQDCLNFFYNNSNSNS